MSQAVDKVIKKSFRMLNKSPKNIKSILENPIIYAVLILFIGIYGPRLSPKLPKVARDLFDNVIFRLVILTLVLYMTNKNLQMALLISIGFMLITSLTNSMQMEEFIIKNNLDGYTDFGSVPIKMKESVEKKPTPIKPKSLLKSLQDEIKTALNGYKNIGF